MTKLHLGCGENYLNGYINIDLPKNENSVQMTDIADLHANLLQISYPANTIEEIRLHHVFEHFSRPIGCALIASWNSWLINNGIIHIEVPDLLQMARIISSPFSSLKKIFVAERHLFGSQEADWAIHYDGYNQKILSLLLELYGFKINNIRKNNWKGTYNIEIIAKKINSISYVDAFEITENYLKNYLIDDSPSEQKILKIWLEQFKKQIDISFSI